MSYLHDTNVANKRRNDLTDGDEAAGINGRVVALDGPFDNLITNVKGDLFQNARYC